MFLWQNYVAGKNNKFVGLHVQSSMLH